MFGKYPEKLLKLWDEYDQQKGSENTNPNCFQDDQQFIVIELAFAGQDLESFCFVDAKQSYFALLQVVNNSYPCLFSIQKNSKDFQSPSFQSKEFQDFLSPSFQSKGFQRFSVSFISMQRIPKTFLPFFLSNILIFLIFLSKLLECFLFLIDYSHFSRGRECLSIRTS